VITSKEDIEFIKKFGTHLRCLRTAKGLSMERLAELSDLDYSQISKIERGVTNTTIRTINKLAKGLEVSSMKLFEFDIEE